MFAENTIYIVGNSKSPQNNPITQQYGQFFIGFVVDRETGEIITCGSSATIAVTAEFICSLFTGKSLSDDFQAIKQHVETRYFGSSQKAILVAYKDAQKKFFRIMSGLMIDFNE